MFVRFIALGENYDSDEYIGATIGLGIAFTSLVNHLGGLQMMMLYRYRKKH